MGISCLAIACLTACELLAPISVRPVDAGPVADARSVTDVTMTSLSEGGRDAGHDVDAGPLGCAHDFCQTSGWNGDADVYRGVLDANAANSTGPLYAVVTPGDAGCHPPEDATPRAVASAVVRTVPAALCEDFRVSFSLIPLHETATTCPAPFPTPVTVVSSIGEAWRLYVGFDDTARYLWFLGNEEARVNVPGSGAATFVVSGRLTRDGGTALLQVNDASSPSIPVPKEPGGVVSVTAGIEAPAVTGGWGVSITDLTLDFDECDAGR